MYTQKNLLKATIPISICQRLIHFTELWHKLIMKRRMFPTFICLYKAIDRIFYRFTSVKTHDWCWENTRKLCESRVGCDLYIKTRKKNKQTKHKEKSCLWKKSWPRLDLVKWNQIGLIAPYRLKSFSFFGKCFVVPLSGFEALSKDR